MKFLNIEIDNITMAEAVDRIDDMVCHSMNQYVVTPNVDHIIRLEKSESFREVYRQAALVLTDGQPLLWFARWSGTPIVEKVSGADLFPKVCERAAQKGYRMFFLGGEEGVAEKAAENLRERYKGLKVVGTYAPPHGFEDDPQASKSLLPRDERRDAKKVLDQRLIPPDRLKETMIGIF